MPANEPTDKVRILNVGPCTNLIPSSGGIKGRIKQVRTHDDGAVSIIVDTGEEEIKDPEPAFDIELQAISRIEYILSQLTNVGARLRVMKFIEDRTNSRE